MPCAKYAHGTLTKMKIKKLKQKVLPARQVDVSTFQVLQASIGLKFAKVSEEEFEALDDEAKKEEVRRWLEIPVAQKSDEAEKAKVEDYTITTNSSSLGSIVLTREVGLGELG